MITDLKPYPEYQESGHAWLGPLPKHWAMRRTKSAVANVVDQTLEMDTDCVYLALEHVESWTGKARPQTDSSLFTGQVKLFRQDDVLFGKLRPYLAKVTRLSMDGVCAGEFFVLRPTDEAVVPAYLEQHLRAKPTIDVINGSTFGAKMPRADWRFIGNLPLPLPPPAEQAAIVRFLDWANGRLERVILKKRKVIGLLGEQKQAIIHRAVTRGLDPAVPLKPSGIPWLREIPTHWEASRSKYVYREIDVRSANGEETHLSMSQRFGLIPSSQVEVRRLVSESYVSAKLCQMGDLVLNRLKAHLGVFALAKGDGLVSPDYTVLRPVREVDERFFEAVYRTPACRVELRQRVKGIVQGFWRLYTDDFYDIRVPVPPVDEQKRIMDQLDIDLAGVNTELTRLEREIGFVREYRTRLAADAVTGKLDVRETAARLPDDAPFESSKDEVDLSEQAEVEEDEAIA